MENKYKVHLAIGEYEFIEKETEGGTNEEFAKSVEELRKLIDKPDGVSDDKFIEMIDSISIGGAVSIDDFEGLNEYQSRLLQAVKRCWKRSPMAKEQQVKR
jgi:hypothetical protein